MRNYLTRVMSLNRDHSGEFGSKTWTVSMYAVQSAINLLAASARSVNTRRVCATVVANRAAGDRGFSCRSGGIAVATVVLRGVGFLRLAWPNELGLYVCRPASGLSLPCLTRIGDSRFSDSPYHRFKVRLRSHFRCRTRALGCPP